MHFTDPLLQLISIYAPCEKQSHDILSAFVHLDAYIPYKSKGYLSEPNLTMFCHERPNDVT